MGTHNYSGRSNVCARFLCGCLAGLNFTLKVGQCAQCCRNIHSSSCCRRLISCTQENIGQPLGTTLHVFAVVVYIQCPLESASLFTARWSLEHDKLLICIYSIDPVLAIRGATYNWLDCKKPAQRCPDRLAYLMWPPHLYKLQAAAWKLVVERIQQISY